MDILKKTAIFFGSVAVVVTLSSASLIALVSTGLVSPDKIHPNRTADSLVVSAADTTVTTVETTQTTVPSATTTEMAVKSTTTTAEIIVKTTTTTKMQAPSSLNGNEIVAYAKQFLGTPYVYAGNDLRNGVDCSGFTKLVYGHFGISLPRTAAAQHKKGTPISYDELLPGDLCTTVYTDPNSQYTGHAAIYIGNNMVINALPEEGVVITDLDYLYGEYSFHRIFNNTAG